MCDGLSSRRVHFPVGQCPAKTNDQQRQPCDRLGARIYGHDATAEADTRGGRVYGHRNDMDARGSRVYGLVNRSAVSHEDADGVPTPERWRLHDVRPAIAVYSTGNYDLEAIGTRVDTRHDAGGIVTIDNRTGRGDTPGSAGFDF